MTLRQAQGDRNLSGIARRAMNMIVRGIVTLVDDSKKMQSVQVETLDSELSDEAERFQQYAFSSVPFEEAEAIVLFPAGTRSHAVVIAVDDRRHRPTDLEPGESVQYDDQGQFIRIYRDRIEINSPMKVIVNSPSVEVNGDAVTVTATNVTVESDTINLGGTGGQAVARVGDSVAGGFITSGSSKVSAL